MGVNPITYSEIDAFNRMTAAGLGPWEVELICRLDDVVAPALADKIGGGGATEPALVPLEDGEGIRALMTRLTVQQSAREAGRMARGE